MSTWQVAIVVALIGQLPVLLTLLRVNQVHDKVRRATNGQHDELVRNQQDTLRRLETLEDEVATIYRAVVAGELKGLRPRRGMLRRRR